MNQTAEWHARRAQGVGGSDIGAILGLSKWKTPVDIWLQKVGRAPVVPATLPLKFGSFMEQFVCDEYSEQTGNRVVRHNALVTNPAFPYMIGNVDRLVVPAGKGKAAIRGRIVTDKGMEAKTASAYGAKDWGDAGGDGVLPDYRAQVEAYMMLTGCVHWDLAVLIGNADFRVYHLHADAELQAMIREAVVEFWERYVLTKTPPPATCERDVARLFPSSTEGKALQASAEMLATLESLKKARRAAEEAGYEVEALETRLKEYMGDAEALKDGDATLCTWKSSAGRVLVDSKALRADYPEVFKIVSKVGEGSRRFSVK